MIEALRAYSQLLPEAQQKVGSLYSLYAALARRYKKLGNKSFNIFILSGVVIIALSILGLIGKLQNVKSPSYFFVTLGMSWVLMYVPAIIFNAIGFFKIRREFQSVVQEKIPSQALLRFH